MSETNTKEFPQKAEIISIEILHASVEKKETNKSELLEGASAVTNSEEGTTKNVAIEETNKIRNETSVICVESSNILINNSINNTNVNSTEESLPIIEKTNTTNIIEPPPESMQSETVSKIEKNNSADIIEPVPESMQIITANIDVKEKDNENNKMEQKITPMPVDLEQKNQKDIIISKTALSLLANYSSDNSDVEKFDSDNESVIEVPTNNPNDYRQQVVEINSDSDSDTDSSDSSDGNKSVNRLTKLRKTINKAVAEDSDDDDDDEEDIANKKKLKQKVPKVKGEMLLDDLPPIQDLHITVPEDECTELGRVHSIVDQLLLVSVLPNSILLDLDTVLFLDKGKRVLGEVFDVLGQVTNPLYCVRFNSNEQIKEKNINIGDIVYVAPRSEYTQYVILSSLMNMRGSDASWENDVEPPPRYLDYSDDEQERLSRQRLRNKDRQQQPATQDDSHKRPRNEDDDDDDDTISIVSTDTLNSEQSMPENWQGRGGRRGRGRGRGRGYYHAHTQGPYGPQYAYYPPYNYPVPPNAYSWHSNFGQMGMPNYGNYMPPMPGNYMPPMPGNYMPPFPQMPMHQMPPPPSRSNSSTNSEHTQSNR